MLSAWLVAGISRCLIELLDERTRMNYSQQSKAHIRLLVYALAALIAMCAVFLPTSPRASATSTQDPEYDRVGYFWSAIAPSGIYVPMVLGAERWEEGKYPEYCVQHTHSPVPREDNSISAGNITQPTVSVSGYELSAAQMAWIMMNYSRVKDPEIQAPIAFLVHVNFEQTQSSSLFTRTGFHSSQEYVQWLARETEKELPQVAERAQSMIREARAVTISGHGSGSVVGAG